MYLTEVISISIKYWLWNKKRNVTYVLLGELLTWFGFSLAALHLGEVTNLSFDSIWEYFLFTFFNHIFSDKMFIHFEKFSIYVSFTGIYYTMSIIGPAVGYVLGGQFLQIYADTLTIDPST